MPAQIRPYDVSGSQDTQAWFFVRTIGDVRNKYTPAWLLLGKSPGSLLRQKGAPRQPIEDRYAWYGKLRCARQ